MSRLFALGVTFFLAIGCYKKTRAGDSEGDGGPALSVQDKSTELDSIVPSEKDTESEDKSSKDQKQKKDDGDDIDEEDFDTGWEPPDPRQPGETCSMTLTGVCRESERECTAGFIPEEAYGGQYGNLKQMDCDDGLVCCLDTDQCAVFSDLTDSEGVYFSCSPDSCEDVRVGPFRGSKWGCPDGEWCCPVDFATLCQDGEDNNGNGNIDCDDTACQVFEFCFDAGVDAGNS